MNRTQEEKLKQLAGELAKDIKTGEDLSSLSAQLVKLTVEAALSAEMENHLGYPPHSTLGHHSGNSRNGTSPKILKGDHGEIRIETPRDRLGSFEPELVKKGQTRISGMDEQILVKSLQRVRMFHRIFGNPLFLLTLAGFPAPVFPPFSSRRFPKD